MSRQTSTPAPASPSVSVEFERRTPTHELHSQAASPTDTVSSGGTKRKRTMEPKFYSVRAGHRPGIYHSWSDCLAQVKGFKNPTFKSFSSLADAEKFLAGPASSLNSSSSTEAPKYYAVRNGRVPGVYTDWPSAQKQITGWIKPKHKSFISRAEAEAFLRGDKEGSTNQPEGSSPSVADGKSDGARAGDEEGQNKRRKKDVPASNVNLDPLRAPLHHDVEPGTGPLPPGAVDGFDPNILFNPKTGKVEYKNEAQRAATKFMPNGASPGGMLRIYTDGSSLGNGINGALAGVGVYFGSGDSRNISEALVGPRQTNQRAELTAILRALEIAPKHRDVTIFTDSRYSIDCVTVWYINWRRNNWQTSQKKPVENRDLIEAILSNIEERNALKVQTLFHWLKGHADHEGNIEADKLAVNGARKAR